MDKEKQKDLIKKFGTSGINMFVHLHCKDAFLQKIAGEEKAVQKDRERQWTPSELMGKYKDITRCDFCGQEFKETDEGYYNAWVTSPEEALLWQEIQAEKNS